MAVTPALFLSGIEGFGDITTFCSGNYHVCAKITSVRTMAIKSAVADHFYSCFSFSIAVVYLPWLLLSELTTYFGFWVCWGWESRTQCFLVFILHLTCRRLKFLFILIEFWGCDFTFLCRRPRSSAFPRMTTSQHSYTGSWNRGPKILGWTGYSGKWKS